MLRKFFAPKVKANHAKDAPSSRLEEQVDPAIARTPDTDAINSCVAQATAHVAAGRYAESLSLINRSLNAIAGAPELLFARAETLFAWGRRREALAGYLSLTASGWQHERLQLRLGWAHYHSGAIGQAEASMRKAVDADSESVAARHGLSLMLIEGRKIDEAVANCEGTLTLLPDDFASLVWRGQCRIEQGKYAAAEMNLRHAIAIDENQAEPWIHLGIALGRQYRHAEALAAFELAEHLANVKGEEPDTFVYRALELQIMGRLKQTLDLCEQNLAQRPAVEGHRIYGNALLTSGRLVEGWNHYEFRWLMEPLLSMRVGAVRPMWAGQDLRGKTVMLRIEQGFGDTIQFLRYAPYLKSLGAIVLLRKFAELAHGFDGIDRIFGDDESLDFDYYVPVMSLPRIFGTDLDSIPAEIPYLRTEPDRVTRWAKRLPHDGAVSIGLVWAGSAAHPRDRDRSMRLRALAPIFEVAGVNWISLQKGPAIAELEAFAPARKILNLGPELDDLADTAAVIAQLDLVVCVDTAIGHLAGALGKPVWLMLQYDNDWRWLEEREDSPWYPTARLFRQKRLGDWADVVKRVRIALEERIATRKVEATCGDGTRENLASSPSGAPVVSVRPSVPPGFSTIAETRYGILQYFPDEPIVGPSIGWYGELLQAQLNLLARMLRPGETILEVGTGIGAHALFLSGMVGAAGHIFVYEQRRPMRRALRQNLNANRAGNVTLMKRALGRPRPPTLRAPSAHDDEASSAQAKSEDAGIETVDELQLDRLRLLKTSEAADAMAVLEGAIDTLWRLRPLLFISVGDEVKLNEVAAKAREMGYRGWRIATPLFNPGNFNRRDSDIFSGKDALALLAIPEEVEVEMALEGCVALS